MNDKENQNDKAPEMSEDEAAKAREEHAAGGKFGDTEDDDAEVVSNNSEQ